LEKFWNVEDSPSDARFLTQEQEEAEQFFVRTTTKDETGRFIVHLPWKRNPHELGDSRETALKRFLLLERKLLRNVSLRERYTKCINEYITLGHVRKVTENHRKSRRECLLHSSSRGSQGNIHFHQTTCRL